ncbi:hypothetical protein EHQ12_08030 [Leptospira gomenensis]|uniref:Uncharacterized protein n=1 Tax=Leptospira gomenensis TaxID=2484974 RepID=A0A5F1YD35_9LEPT|nr:hypothetical protein [Leptospira gomenensis]TGK35990.1 hypothetical protein EHQ17_05265 [Leptospira gomenensis]TGK39979.1 hypothetical protein EHQ12_08030 [Leptospira gomenensis]TGK51428.1 hypothetical protein EHQ07_02420 [Leptospira gomenensis]TGK64897.1 hypothetical protein EHQ13_06535 [Leptospira gomenensis]
MIGLKLRIALLTVSVLSFFYYLFVPYFPEGVYFKSRIHSVFVNFNEELGRLETGIRNTKSFSDQDKIQLEFPSVSGIKSVSESELTGRRDSEGKLLSETLKEGASRLFFLKSSLVLCIPDPTEKRMILAEIREDRLRISFGGTDSILVPDLKFGGYIEPGKQYQGINGDQIASILISDLGRSQNEVTRLTIGKFPFIGYYYAAPENSFSFVKGVLILKPGNEGLGFLFLSGLFAFLFLIDLTVRLLRMRRDLFSDKEGKEIQDIVSHISKGVSGLQTAKQKALELLEKDKSEEIKTLSSEEVDFDLKSAPIILKEVKKEGSSIFVLPFELKAEGFITPAFLRDPEKFKTSATTSPELERKRSEIFNPELETLIAKVRAPEPSEPSAEPNKTAEVDPFSRPIPEPAFAASTERLELGPGYRKWLDSLTVRDRRKILEVLDELSYGLESEYSFILKYYISVFSHLKLSGFAIHYYDRRNGSYNPFVTYGLKEKTVENMIFLYDDQYIGKESGEYSLIGITEERKNDRFFRKKFDPADLESCITMLTITLSNFGIPFRFFLLFKDPPSESASQEIENLIFHSLEPVVPSFEKYDRKILGELFRDKRDIVSSRIHMMRISTDGERGITKSYYVEFHGKDYSKLESLRKTAISEIAEFIGPEDMCFGIGVGVFGIYTRKDLESSLRSVLDKLGAAYEFKADFFPKDGKNLFTYL